MYIPSPFNETDADMVKTLMATYPLATLVVSSDDGLLADHLPMTWHCDQDGRWLLQGHVARGNSIWRLLPAKALLIFQGPDCYISPNWYPSKHRDGKAVPTWNYIALHLQGEVRAIDDAQWITDLLERLTHTHEQQQTRPWQLSDAPKDYIDKLLKAIVGLEFSVSSWQCKAKASQNQSAENQQGVVAGLTATGGSAEQQAMAHWVQARLKEHSPVCPE